MDIRMIRGDTLTLDLVVTQDGAPIDLTGSTMWMTAKLSANDLDVDAVFQVTSPTNITFTNAALGMARIQVPPAKTSGLTILAGKTLYAFYDIQLQFASGSVHTVDGGAVTIIPDITRAI